MKSLVSFAFATALVTFATAKTTFHSPIEGIEAKRAYLTCQESYGDGSITCGDANSLYCYNPTLGESCCPLDDGTCDKGFYCAPVAGYCCPNDEDVNVCAISESFTIPPASTPSTVPAAASTTSVPLLVTSMATPYQTTSVAAVSTPTGNSEAGSTPATSTSSTFTVKSTGAATKGDAAMVLVILGVVGLVVGL